ncbi:Short-chain dehydrogenase reductase family [Fusarium albosuccineum]|uniref:Short-chain dehydrogenase reductase family n=1 Tax=Fusarium albosuccineum TaxID=1237068 RepID=A0A8H4KLM4_9HYPO|nr:Short-chain dehydrogenase reductase family [Fusarium albosuccineum]
MAPSVPLSASNFIRSQKCVKPPVPTKSFAGQIVIVTGSNTGMGLEAARHIARLGAEKVILAVRSLERGRAAASSIVQSTRCAESVIEVWQLDLASYGSIQAFANKVESDLLRLDAVIENAGMLAETFELAEEDERTIKVNVLGTMLLALLLLPKLRRTAQGFNKDVVLTFTGSWMHWTTDFPERNADSIFDALADEKSARMANNERYSTSKLIELLAFRELVARLTQPQSGHIVTSMINPGGVATDITRDGKGLLFKAFVRVSKMVFLRTAEEGSRTLVHAAEGGRETDGQYLDDCQPARPELVSPFVTSKEGVDAQAKVWRDIMQRLERVKADVADNI